MNKLLRRLEGWQITAVAAVTALILLLVWAYALTPLLMAWLEPLGAVSAVITIIVGLAYGWFVIGAAITPFIRARLERKSDEAMERLVAAYAESKRADQRNG